MVEVVDDGNAEFRLDCVQGAADGIGMDLGGNVERLEAALDDLERRFDQDSLPTEPGEPGANGKEPPPVGHRACHQVREVLTFQREEALHPFQSVVASLQCDPAFPANPVRVVRVEGKRFPLPCVHQHDRLGNARAPDDVPSVAHYSQPACAWGGETTVPGAHVDYPSI